MYNGYKMNKFKYKKNILASEEDICREFFFSSIFRRGEIFYKYKFCKNLLIPGEFKGKFSSF